MLIWIQFIACTCVIMFAGTKLSKYGDLIADRTGLGHVWIGVILMASVTSLPELITGVSSVVLFNLPDIAVGDVLGSCMFNILIIALLDMLNGPKPVLSQAEQGQSLTAAFGIMLLGFVSLSMAIGSDMLVVGWIGLYSPVFLLVYLIAMRSIFQYEKKRLSEDVEEDVEFKEYDISKSRLYGLYAFNALLVIGAAIYLPHIGEQLAEMTGLGQTFVGSLFIAFTTSLPEVVVSVAALRIGAVDMAIGNLMGSNLFNIGILAIDDLFYTKGDLFSSITNTHQITAIAAIIMTSIAIIGIMFRSDHKRSFISGGAFSIVIVYLVATVSLIFLR